MPILKSRKFWIAVFDVVISCLTYFIPEYTDPILGNHILWLIAAWQPIFYALIVGTTQEDVALKKRTDYIDIVNTVLERSDLDLKNWADRISRLEKELDCKRMENSALELKIEQLQRSNAEKDITIAQLNARVNQLESELARLKGSNDPA